MFKTRINRSCKKIDGVTICHTVCMAGSVAKFGFGRWSPKAGPMISRAYRCLQARKTNFATEPPAVKSRWAGEWGGWGRLSEDGPGQHNPDPSEGPWGGGRPT